jgi:hypothetical protein
MVFLPIFAFGLLFLVVIRKSTSSGRVAFLYAATIWGVLTAGVTEILSLFHGLTWWGLAVSWTLINLVSLLFVVRLRPGLRSLFAQARSALASMNDLDVALLAGAFVIVAAVGLIAIVSPPNTWDAMTYHMPRIVHWLQNRNIRFYATNEFRQLQSPPWAEYAILQLHGLSGSDRFDNLVQWFSLLGSAIGASLVAQTLNADVRGQVLALVLAVTIPQGILEASGAGNDCVAAFWLVAALYFALSFRNDPGLRNSLLLGFALGLGCLTKATTFVLAPPLVAVALFAWPQRSIWKYSKNLIVVVTLALILNSGHFFRNQQLFHSVLGPSAQAPPNGFKVTNDVIGLLPTLSNVLRNLALHAGTPSGFLNRKAEAVIGGFLRALGQNPDDPRTTWDFTRFQVVGPSLHEAFAGNPLDAGLILAVCVLLLWHSTSQESKLALSLAAALVASFVAFCAVFKWQPWHTRLHLPLFVVWAGIVGSVLIRYLPRVAAGVVGITLLLAATPDVFANKIRPLIALDGASIFTLPRTDLYFDDRRPLLSTYPAAAQFTLARRCDEIGLHLSSDQYEYPLHVLLGNVSGSRRIRNVNVANASSLLTEVRNAPVTCVICPECAPGKPGWDSLVQMFGSPKLFGDVAVLAEGRN